MSLSNEYRRQIGWRHWDTVLDALPPMKGQMVFDLGCAVGDQAALLAARGARVIGFDLNEEFIREARSRRLPGAEFRTVDLRSFPVQGITADGLWCSFAAAYLPDLTGILSAWSRNLKPGGWIAVTEIDDLFGHEPLDEATRHRLSAYAAESFASGRYDFRMGRKLKIHLERSGFAVSKTLILEDRELSFDGPALPEVLDAWRARFGRMTLLREFCGPEFAHVEEEFLRCLARADHRSLARVYCWIGAKGLDGGRMADPGRVELLTTGRAGARDHALISKIASTSTAEPVGIWAKPRALRAWWPSPGLPKISCSRSLQPLTTRC
jgi:SAM-dependent methyltransferase